LTQGLHTRSSSKPGTKRISSSKAKFFAAPVVNKEAKLQEVASLYGQRLGDVHTQHLIWLLLQPGA